MGKHVAFVLLLGGCFNIGHDATAGCEPDPLSECTQLAPGFEGYSCDSSLHSCPDNGRCKCSLFDGSWSVVCSFEDMSVPRDLASPWDLASPPDDGGGSD